MEYRVLQPAEIAELVPHWPELDSAKMRRIHTRNTRVVKVQNRATGQHDRFNVLDVDPILIGPMNETGGLLSGQPDLDYIANGKHRAIIALKRRLALYAARVESPREILYNLSARCLGTHTREALAECFAERHYFQRICNNVGIYNMQDLLDAQEVARPSIRGVLDETSVWGNKS